MSAPLSYPLTKTTKTDQGDIVGFIGESTVQNFKKWLNDLRITADNAILVDGSRAFTGKQTIDDLGLDSASGDTFLLTSNETDSATAVGFRQKQANSLTTAGSVLWTVDDVTDPILQIKNVTASNPTLVYTDKGSATLSREFQIWKDKAGTTHATLGTDNTTHGYLSFPTADITLGSTLYSTASYGGIASTYGDVLLGTALDQVTYLNAVNGSEISLGTNTNRQNYIYNYIAAGGYFSFLLGASSNRALYWTFPAAGNPYAFTFGANATGLSIQEDSKYFFWGGGDDSSISDDGADMLINSDYQVAGGRLIKFAAASNWTANGTATVTISNVAPAGVGTATISKWFTVKDNAGGTYYIPAWT